MDIVLATSETCGSCKAVKEQIEKNSYDVEIVDLTDDPQFFLEHKIKTLPTLIVGDGTLKVYGPNAIMEYLREISQ